MGKYTVQKQLTGEVWILDYTTQLPVRQLTEDAALLLSEHRGGGVLITDLLGNFFDLWAASVVDTQILPAAAVPFAGDSYNLYKDLEGSFFVNILNPTAGGGGGVNETNIISKGINYTLLTTDYIVYATADITLTLPAIPLTGQVYKIYAAGNTVTVAANVGQVIIDETAVEFSGQDAIIVQYIKTNFWAII
jgi:hypothetical protein